MKKFKMIIDILLLLDTILLLDIDTSGRLFHEIFGRLAIIIMFLHIGMHFRKEKNKKLRNIIYLIYIIIAIVSSVYSIYLLQQRYG